MASNSGNQIIFRVGEEEILYSVPANYVCLVHSGYDNGLIFRKLGVEDRDAFCREAYGYEPAEGIFPECKRGDKEALQRVIDSLQKKCQEYNERLKSSTRPLYKVGDKVRIKKREGSSEDYRFGFTDGMVKYSGEICTIRWVSTSPEERTYTKKDDGYTYFLKEENGYGYTWASSMFEPVSESEAPKIEKKKQYRIEVTFHINGHESLRCERKNCYWDIRSYFNDEIFNILGLDRYEFCSKAYGYETSTGDWPESNENDWDALERVIVALEEECKKYNASHPLDNPGKIEEPKVKDDLPEEKKRCCGIHEAASTTRKGFQIRSSEKEIKLYTRKKKYSF